MAVHGCRTRGEWIDRRSHGSRPAPTSEFAPPRLADCLKGEVGSALAGGVETKSSDRSPSVSDTTDLERRLRDANERLQRAVAALAPRHQGGEWEEYDAAHQEVLGLEREV